MSDPHEIGKELNQSSSRIQNQEIQGSRRPVICGHGALIRPSGPNIPVPLSPSAVQPRPPPLLFPDKASTSHILPAADKIIGISIPSSSAAIQHSPKVDAITEQPLAAQPAPTLTIPTLSSRRDIHVSYQMTGSSSPSASAIPSKQALFNDRPQQPQVADVIIDDAWREDADMRERKVRKQLDPTVKQALQARTLPRNRVVKALPTEIIPSSREERPAPPYIRPPGIPDDQPPPPSEKPAKDGIILPQKKQPPSIDVSIVNHAAYSKPEPPQIESPNKKGKKTIVRRKSFVSRRDRENPEFELSDDDEDKEDFDRRVVNPPLAESNELEKLEEVAREHLRNYSSIQSNIPKGDQSVVISDEKSPVTASMPPKSSKFPDSTLRKVEIDLPVDRPRPESIEISPISLQSFTYEGSMKVPSSPIKVGDWMNNEKMMKSMFDVKTQPVSSKYVVNEINLEEEVEPDSYNMMDDHRLAGFLSRGRFSITCIEALQLFYSSLFSQSGPVHLSLRCRLGPKTSPITGNINAWKSTDIYSSPRGDNPIFENDYVSFDVVDVRHFISMNDLSLHIQVIQHANGFQEHHDMRFVKNEEVIASVTMSVIRFFRQPFVKYEERVPLRTRLDNNTSKLRLRFLFEEARSGMFVFKLYNAANLRFIDPSNKQDPYVKLTLGANYVKESSICLRGDDCPNFQEEEIIMWLDEINWTNNLTLYILDNDYREENPIGITSFSLLPYVNNRPEQAQRATYDLYYKEEIEENGVFTQEERKQGELIMKITYLPAGKLMVMVGKALGLNFPVEYKHDRGQGFHERLDAFVELSIEGQAANMLKRTPIDKDGGHDPIWQYEIEFDIVDQYNLMIQVFHQPAIGEDVLLGSAEFPLFQVYRNGRISSWIPLKQRRNLGGVSDAGNIFLDLKFSALPGIAYPQYRKNMESYDDTIRQLLPEKEDEKEDISDHVINEAMDATTTVNDLAKKHESKPSTMAKADEIASLKIAEKTETQEFTEKEIQQAFNFIDLNHNGFIGASEIRHILTCMGELITDEEIDMMIGMVDRDGDGQVSYLEFRTLVLHPNPESVDLHKEVQKEMEREALQDKLSLRGKATSLDIKSFQRHKELRQRELKKAGIINMIEENDMSFFHVQRAFEMFCVQDPANRVDGRINFDLFCRLLNVDPIYEYQQLHRLFDEEELRTIDFREFLLSFMNFINVDREQRVRFSFKMFDEKLTGYIGKKQISEILRGNHMISLASVSRKCDTIMRHSSAAAGEIDLNDFLAIAKKFPNILFPSLGKQLSEIEERQDSRKKIFGEDEDEVKHRADLI